MREEAFGFRNQFKPVLPGHTDIGNKNVGTNGSNQIQSVFSVCSCPRRFYAEPFPVDKRTYQSAYFFFIINDYKFHHPSFIIEQNMKKRKNLHTKIFHLFVIFSYYRAPYFHAILFNIITKIRSGTVWRSK